MLHERIPNLAKLVEPDRVHRLCYTDQDIFDLEIKNIFEKTWQYCGHDTQIPKAGDFFTFQIGRQPMVMVRAEDGKIHVLYNRCAHRGVQVCGSRKGHADGALTCPYHAWRFHFDGTLESVPLEKGYRDTNFKKNDPAFSMTPAASVDIYRGFVFAKLDPSGPSLEEWMGPAKIAIDDMCDRSPVGRVEVVQPYNRVIQRSNWKFFMENQLDALHASVTHLKTGDVVTWGDLLHLTLIASDNAAARALARVSPYGSIGFIRRMNEKAAELGLKSTHYADPSGLLSENVSSAFDMARLITNASNDDRIGSIMRTPQYTVHSKSRDMTFRSTNHLLGRSDVEVRAGKTGFISKAGYCLATLLRLPQGGQEVAVVVLGARSNAARFMETQNLFNWLSAKATTVFATSAPLGLTRQPQQQ